MTQPQLFPRRFLESPSRPDQLVVPHIPPTSSKHRSPKQARCFLHHQASLSSDESHHNPTISRIRSRLDDILHLRFLEVPGMKPTPPPPLPEFPYSKKQCQTTSGILQADVAALGRCWEWCKWWLAGWQVPLQPEYDAPSVTNYFLRRPHLLFLRMLQVSVFFSSTWLLIASDTVAIRAAEADGIPSDSPEISSIRRRSAARLKAALLQLGPTFVKVAQSISTRPDIVGPDTAAVLAELQDRLPPFPTADALRLIEEELQLPSAYLAFASLGPEPVAAASLGQVYQGTTRDGKLVAVKVQRPGVLLTVARDICILRMLLRLLRRVARINSDLGLLADELGGGLFGELDYRKEAANAEEFAAAHAHMPEVVVPGIHHGLTRRRVLTMDWIDGDRTADLLALARLEPLSVGTQPPPWGTEVVYRTAEEGGGLADGLSAEGLEEAKELARAKLLAMVGIGVECSLEQLLGSGLLHADPHPGNLLFTRDGRLAYLDFGLLCRMQPQHQAAMLAAIAHLVNGEWARLTEDLDNMDVLKPTTDRNAVTMALQESFSASVAPRDSGVPGDNLQFGQISSSLWKMALRFRFRLPPYYTLVLRSLASLEGIAIAVDPNFRVFACAYPFVVRRLLTDRSPSSHKVLRNLVLTPDGRLRWERFASFATSSSLASREAAVSLASPSLRQKASEGSPSSSPWQSDSSASESDRAAWEGRGPPGTGESAPRQGGSGGGSFDGQRKGSRALLLLDLLLSLEASTTRRMLLKSDVQYLAEAFVSSEAAPARSRLVEVLTEACYHPLRGLVQGAPLGPLGPPNPAGVAGAPQHNASSDLYKPDRLLPVPRMGSDKLKDHGAAVPAGALLPESGHGAHGDSSSQRRRHSRGAVHQASKSKGLPRKKESVLAPGGGLDGRANTPGPLVKRDIRRKRLWVLLRSAFFRMGGGPLLKLKVLLVALFIVLSALVLVIRNLILESGWQLWRSFNGSEPPPTAVA